MTNDYPHSTQSALRRTRRIITQAGYTLGSTSGRYPNYEHQRGWNCARIGCSDSILLEYSARGPNSSDHPTLVELVELLRSVGLSYTDTGRLNCAYTD